MRDVSYKGVVIGGIVDIVSTNVLSIPLVFYAESRMDLANMPREQVQSAVVSAMHANPGILAAQIIIGVGCSVLAGWLAARIAKRAPLLNGALSSWLCIAFGLFAVASGSATGSIFIQMADFVVAPVAGLAGGYLRKIQVQK